MELRRAILRLAVDAIVPRGPGRPAIPRADEAAVLVAAARGGQRALRGSRRLRDDVDDAVHGIGAPQRATRAANHFNPLHVLEQHVLRLPIGAGEQRRIDGAPVDQHQHRAREAIGEAAHADRPGAAVDAGHLHPGRQPQRLRNRHGSRTADVVLRDDVDGRGDAANRLGPAVHRRHVELEQVGQAHALHLFRGRLRRGAGGGTRDDAAGGRRPARPSPHPRSSGHVPPHTRSSAPSTACTSSSTSNGFEMCRSNPASRVRA